MANKEQETKSLTLNIRGTYLYPHKDKEDNKIKSVLAIDNEQVAKINKMLLTNLGHQYTFKDLKDYPTLKGINLSTIYNPIVKNFETDEVVNEFAYHGALVCIPVKFKVYTYMGKEGLTCYYSMIGLIKNGEHEDKKSTPLKDRELI